PWIGRWLSPDPAGLVDGTDRYAYSRNNPIVNSDPNGTDSGTEEPEPEIPANETITPKLAQAVRDAAEKWKVPNDPNSYSLNFTNNASVTGSDLGRLPTILRPNYIENAVEQNFIGNLQLKQPQMGDNTTNKPGGGFTYQAADRIGLGH